MTASQVARKYVPRAQVNRDTRGLIKLVADGDTGRLLGAHVLADSAGDIIATAVYALTNQMTVAHMAQIGPVPDHGRRFQARRPDFHQRRDQTVLLRLLTRQSPTR